MYATEFTAEEFDETMEGMGLQVAIDEASNALKVIELTPHIKKYLLENDPKAYEQVLRAIDSIAEYTTERWLKWKKH